MRRRIVVLVTLALVMAAMLASSALPASAVPISRMSCAQLAKAAERAALNWSLGGGGRKAESNRLEALGKEAERKGCGEYAKRGDVRARTTITKKV